MILNEINEIKDYLEKCIKAENFTLAKVSVHDQKKREMVQPKVTLGCLPHQNFSMYGASDEFFQAPYILVGFSDAVVDLGKSTSLNVLIQVCCGSTTQYDAPGVYLPDNLSFADCILTLEWIARRIQKKWSFCGRPIEGAFEIGLYDTKELTYPFSYGYVSFNLSAEEIVFDRKQFNYM